MDRGQDPIDRGPDLVRECRHDLAGRDRAAKTRHFRPVRPRHTRSSRASIRVIDEGVARYVAEHEPELSVRRWLDHDDVGRADAIHWRDPHLVEIRSELTEEDFAALETELATLEHVRLAPFIQRDPPPWH